MRARFFNTVSSFTLGFMAGCIAAEKFLETDAGLLNVLASRFECITSVFVADFVSREFTGGNKREIYISNNIGFFLGYEYTLANAQAAKLEGTLPRVWRSPGPRGY